MERCRSVRRLKPSRRALRDLGLGLHRGRLVWSSLGDYSGDPVAYLNNARAMTWFYEGRAREPVFNYATKLWLWLTNDADIAVSAASTVFSVLCIPATYLLARLAFGRAVGLIAAFIIAIEPDMISWGVQGWRDDTFTFFFLAFGVSCLMFRAKPSTGRTVLLAIASSLTLLTRLTALSFVAPAFLLLAWETRRSRRPGDLVLRHLTIAVVAIAVLVSPYLINSWVRFGDPLIAINRNTTFYRARVGQAATEPMRTDVYLTTLVRERPVTTIDTVLQGLTTYPFRNKFHRLRAWNRWLPRVLSVLAVIGLLWWPWWVAGRWLLLLLGFSLVPYAFTWEIRGGAEWRFTMHAYSIYLIAAVSCTTACAGVVQRAFRTGVRFARPVLARMTISITLAIALAIAISLMPYPRFREALAIEKNALVLPGWRDVVFFRHDWHAPVGQHGVTSRTSRGQVARVWIPLVPGRAYRVIASVAPVLSVAETPLAVRAYVNGQMMAWNRLPDDSFGDFAFDVDAASVESNLNVLTFRTNRLSVHSNAPLRDETTIKLRSLRVTMREEVPEASPR